MIFWDPALLEELAQDYQLIVFDNLGVGLSSDTAENHTTIARMADDAAGVIVKLGYEKVNILAWSMGARSGLTYHYWGSRFIPQKRISGINLIAMKLSSNGLSNENCTKNLSILQCTFKKADEEKTKETINVVKHKSSL